MTDEEMIADILRHLDNETRIGAARMSVEVEKAAKARKEVSHKCCRAYGRPANETVGLLDMYTDLSMREDQDGSGGAQGVS